MHMRECSPSPALWQPLLAGLLVTACAAVPVARDPRFFWNDDYQLSFLPAFEEIDRAWRAGEWPLLTQSSWVSGNLAGEYQFGTFSPVVNGCILAIWSLGLPLAGRAAAFSLSHLFVLASGSFVLARSRGLGPPLATFVSFVATLNGWIICWAATNWIPALTSFAWLPWTWWALEHAAAPRWHGRWITAAATFLYLSLTAGWPFTTLMLLLLTAWIGTRRLAGGDGLRPLLPLATAWTLGGLMTLPAFWMLIDHMRGSQRATGGAGLNWTWTVPPLAWPGMLAPTAPTAWNGFIGPVPHLPLELANGLAPPVMLVAGLALAPRPCLRERRAWLVFLGILATLSMLPSAGVLRWSFRWLPLLHLVLALAAAEVWQAADEGADAGPTGRRWPRLRHAAGLGGVLLGLGYLTLCGGSLPGFDRQVFDQAIIAALWAGLGFFAASRPALVAWLPTGVVAAILLTLFLRVPANLAVPVFPFDESFLDAAPLDRERLHFSLYLEEDMPTGPLPPGGLGQAFRPGNSAMFAGIRMVNGYSPIQPRGIGAMLPFETHGQMFPEGVKWVFEAGAGPGDLLAVIGVNALVVSKNAARLGSLPATEWRKVWSGAEADVFHRRGVAGRTAAMLAPGTPADRPPPRTPLIIDARHRAEIDLPVADDPRLVVFPRPWFTGWRATLNGRSLATTAYQGVAIAAVVPPQASGRLAIAYHPTAFTIGVPIAVSAMLATLALAVVRPGLTAGTFRWPG